MSTQLRAETIGEAHIQCYNQCAHHSGEHGERISKVWACACDLREHTHASASSRVSSARSEDSLVTALDAPARECHALGDGLNRSCQARRGGEGGPPAT